MSGVRVFFEAIQQRPQFPTDRRAGRLDEVFEDAVFRVVDLVFGAGRRGLAAVRAELVMGRERFPAVAAGFSDCVRAVVIVDDTRLAEDVLRVLLASDVLVDFPHVGVERPVDAMLDLGAAVPLSDHAGDRGVAEGVRVDRLVEIGPIGDAPQLLADRVRPDRPVATPPLFAIATVGFELVEQRRARFVRPRVSGPEIGPQRRRRVDQRVLAVRCALEALGVGVGRVRRRVAEIHVAHPQRERHREPDAGIGQEVDERHVALVASGPGELLDVGRFQHLVDLGAAAVDGRAVDIVDPVGVGGVVEELQDGRFVGVDRRIREVVIVAESEDEIVERLGVHLDQRRVRALGRDAGPSEVRFKCRDGHRPIPLANPLCDRLSVGRVDSIGVCEPLAGFLEPLVELLRIINAHSCRLKAMYYKVTVRRTTSSISSERVETSRNSPDAPNVAIDSPASSTASSGVVA